mgnify:CR=1 FL=1
MEHKECISLLYGKVGEAIIRELCLYSPTVRNKYNDTFVRYWCLPEFTIRYDKGTILPDGRFAISNRRMDAVILVQPTVNSLSQNFDFKVCIEIKTTINDLKKDDKMTYYLGWTDFFLLCVPDHLMEAAIEKASDDHRIGVASITTGKIQKRPAWQDVPIGRKYGLMEQAFYKYSNNNKMNSFLLSIV